MSFKETLTSIVFATAVFGSPYIGWGVGCYINHNNREAQTYIQLEQIDDVQRYLDLKYKTLGSYANNRELREDSEELSNLFDQPGIKAFKEVERVFPTGRHWGSVYEHAGSAFGSFVSIISFICGGLILETKREKT